MNITTLIGIGLIALIAVYLIFMIFFLNKQKSESEVENVFDAVLQKKNKIKLFYFEQVLVEKFNVNENQIKFFIYSERALIAVAVVIPYLIMGFVGIGIFACVVILILLNNQLRQEIYKSGINRIGDTVAFMDYFVPSINSGNSASQAFLGYINKLAKDDPNRELLIQYRNAKSNNDLRYETPEAILNITSIYENALYNEEKGVDNYLYIIEEAKRDLFQKQKYYTDYATSVNGVIKPIAAAYYVGVPFCIFMTMGSAGDFWYTIWGVIAVILLCIFFFLFRFLLNKLELSTIKKIL